MKRIAILGSTGSIGRSTLSVVESYPDRFQVSTLAAGNNAELAFEQAVRWKPRLVSLADEAAAQALQTRLRLAGLGETEVEVVHGAVGTVRVATHPEVDFVVSAIVGVSGLEATYEAVRAGKTVGLANKECLVVAGELITAEARKQGKPLLPIDSEHNAVHQCLRGGRMEEVERIPSELRFSVSDLRHLDFSPPDMVKFPCLRLAYEAVAAGGAKTIALNAADEVAVAAFLEEHIRFDEIPRIIEEVMAATPAGHLESIQRVLSLDTEARLLAREIVHQCRRKGSPIRAIS